jgi:hypothetical protein
MARESYNSAKNIIVGASPLFISKSQAGLSKLDPTSGAEKVDFVANESYIDTLNGTTGATKWRNVGYTNNGLQITYNPSYGSVTVDQLLDTAKLFKESMEVMLMTEMAEGTLENLVVVFGQPDVANIHYRAQIQQQMELRLSVLQQEHCSRLQSSVSFAL